MSLPCRRNFTKLRLTAIACFSLLGAQSLVNAQEASALATPFAVCEDSQQDIAACRKEIARTQNLKVDPATETPDKLQQNALRRCDVFKNDAQALAACKDRVLGIDNTENSGSAMQGGILKRQTLPVTQP